MDGRRGGHVLLSDEGILGEVNMRFEWYFHCFALDWLYCTPIAINA